MAKRPENFIPYHQREQLCSIAFIDAVASHFPKWYKWMEERAIELYQLGRSPEAVANTIEEEMCDWCDGEGIYYRSIEKDGKTIEGMCRCINCEGEGHFS